MMTTITPVTFLAQEILARSPTVLQPDDQGHGGKGIRTPDLLIANETLYQLSYTPKEEQQLSWRNDFSASDSENSEQPDLAGVGSLTPSAKVAVTWFILTSC